MLIWPTRYEAPVGLQDQIRHGRILVLPEIALVLRHGGGGYRDLARLALLVSPSPVGDVQIIGLLYSELSCRRVL
jgi:hypothetical protein